METRIEATEAEEKKSQNSREKWKYREQEKKTIKKKNSDFFLTVLCWRTIRLVGSEKELWLLGHHWLFDQNIWFANN